MFEDASVSALRAIDTWFNKNSLESQSTVNSCCGNGIEFLALIAEQQTAVGCALSQVGNSEKWICVLSNSIKQSQPVYTSGSSASECKKDQEFSALCASSDYCGICENHVGCGNDGGFGGSCPSNAKVLSVAGDVKDRIVAKINNLRNSVAGGNQVGFGPAKKMNFVVSRKI